MRREHGADHGEVIHLSGEVGHYLGEPQTGLTMLSEPKRSGQQSADAIGIQIGLGDGFPGGLLALKFLELRLGVKEVDVAWSSLHDQVNHRLRPGLEMRGAGLHVKGVSAWFCWRRRAVKVLAEQVSQSSSVGSRADAVEKTAPAHGG